MSSALPTMSYEVITPAKARKFLKGMKKNRPLIESRVDEFLAMYERGEFTPEESTISFNGDGVLVDGQHRLHLVDRLGISMKFRVQKNVSHDFFAHVDDVMVRRLPHLLSMEGEEDTTLLSATIRAVYSYETTGYWDSGKRQMGFPSNMVYMEYLEKNPGLRDSRKFAASIKNKLTGMVNPSIVAGTHFLFSRLDEDLASQYWHGVAGDDVAGGVKDPRYVLRQRLIRGLQSPAMALKPRYKAAISIKGWNNWVTGEEVSVLRWFPASGEAFPKIITEL